MKRPWTKQDDETPKAFEAFQYYRDMGPGRSLRKMCEKHFGDDAAKLRQIETWSSKFDWVDRTDAYDAHLDAQRLAEIEDAQRKAQHRLSEAALDLVDEAIEAAKGGDITSAQAQLLRDLLDRIGLAPVQTQKLEHSFKGDAAQEVREMLGLGLGD